MMSIDRAALDRVSGGDGRAPNVLDVRTKDGPSYHQELSDYGYCAKIVKDSCDQSNTSWLFGKSASGAKACVDRTLVPNCGLPPADATSP